MYRWIVTKELRKSPEDPWVPVEVIKSYETPEEAQENAKGLNQKEVDDCDVWYKVKKINIAGVL